MEGRCISETSITTISRKLSTSSDTMRFSLQVISTMCWHVTSQCSAATLPSRSITISNRIIFNQTRTMKKKRAAVLLSARNCTTSHLSLRKLMFPLIWVRPFIGHEFDQVICLIIRVVHRIVTTYPIIYNHLLSYWPLRHYHCRPSKKLRQI